MVVDADTVIDPRAVMVKALDTPLANAAVAGAVRAHNLTVSAKQNGIEDFHHLHEGNTLWALEVSRVLAHSAEMQDDRQSEYSSL